MQSKGIEDLVTCSVRKVKRAAAVERRLLCRRTVKVKVKSKVISMSYLRIVGRGTFVEAKDQIKRDG